MSNVINMPERKTSRAREFQSVDMKKAFLSLSLLSLIVMAVSLNDHWTSGQRNVYVISDSPGQLKQLNRAIASAQPHYLFRDVEWEHRLASRLANYDLKRAPAAVPAQKTEIDNLRYGVLAGKYRLQQEQSKISEIEYIDSIEQGDHPQDFSREQFLSQYKDLFVVPYDRSAMESHGENREIHRLFDKKGQAIGRAAFELDERGHVLSLKFENQTK